MDGHLKARGTYILVLRLDGPAVIQIGRLGAQVFAAGHYVYVGSALGAGGLASRLNHHLSWAEGRAVRKHWHIDYLLQQATVVQVWYRVGPERLECEWARALAAQPAFQSPVPGFGSSDCRCPSHLLFTRLPPDQMGLAALSPDLRRL